MQSLQREGAHHLDHHQPPAYVCAVCTGAVLPLLLLTARPRWLFLQHTRVQVPCLSARSIESPTLLLSIPFTNHKLQPTPVPSIHRSPSVSGLTSIHPSIHPYTTPNSTPSSCPQSDTYITYLHPDPDPRATLMYPLSITGGSTHTTPNPRHRATTHGWEMKAAVVEAFTVAQPIRVSSADHTAPLANKPTQAAGPPQDGCNAASRIVDLWRLRCVHSSRENGETDVKATQPCKWLAAIPSPPPPSILSNGDRPSKTAAMRGTGAGLESGRPAPGGTGIWHH